MEDNQIIQVEEANMERMASMQLKIATTPKLLRRTAGNASCSIFRIPETLLKVTGRVYQPHLVSIGPYHHGKPELQMIEEHKWRLLGTLLNRSTQPVRTLGNLLRAIQPLEASVRECYSENIDVGTDEFIEMLVLDGCFIIELFRMFGKVVPVASDDALMSIAWVKSLFFRDLIRIENQIPFFILQELFNMTTMPQEVAGPSLSKLTMTFFNWVLLRPNQVVGTFTGNHLLDFARSTFIPPQQGSPQNRKPPHTHLDSCISILRQSGKYLLDFARSTISPPDQGNSQNRQPAHAHLIPCISMLRKAGIKLKPGESESFLAVKFSDGVIQMPKILIGDFMRCFLANCVAYEQCHKHCTKHFTTYATLLNCLINTSNDVEFLSGQNILENYLGDNGDVAKYINNLGKDVLFDINKCYLADLFIDVNKHYKSNWHVHLASLRYTYFSSPWSFISAFAAFVLLGLTVLQTYYTMIGYINRTKLK